MTRRHPDHALVSNPNDTAPPTRRAHQQSAWHSATHATRTPAIRMAQRHPRDAHTSHPHGTAPPTRHARQQSPWHSATQRPGETRTPSSKKQHTTGEQPATARNGPHRPATARNGAHKTPPLRSDLRPLKVIPRFDFFGTRSSSHAPQQHPPVIRSVTPEASPRNFLR